MYVCLCNGITDRQFCAHAGNENCTVSTVYRSLGARPKCGKCVPYVRQLVRQLIDIPLPEPTTAAPG